MKDRMPPIDQKMVEELERMYPPLEYSPDVSKETWAFRGGQRDVISKLKHILIKQEKGN